MRKSEFNNKIVANALDRAGYKCERCWSSRNLEVHHRNPKSLNGPSNIDNAVVLCRDCHKIAPNDPILFNKMFLKFASIKEMIQYYNVENEDQAWKKWCEEVGYDFNDISKSIAKIFPGTKYLTKKGMQKLKKDGYWMGRIPDLFEAKEENNHVKITPKPIVYKILKLREAGNSYRKIAKELGISHSKVWRATKIMENF
jgi:hypothetical protein